MPANNRMQTSASLNTHGIWQNAIGCADSPNRIKPSQPITACTARGRYDPYAAEGSSGAAASSGEAGDNAYENMKSLLALARMKQGAKGEEDRGGRVTIAASIATTKAAP